ncbi:hypothetical protein [Ilumatobacter nonamiensis]|uniref:hypothetical protein n=1 Tax=Ilumatobacter nonamiensis TaxID=467093 RepID=UPI00058F20BB|nr:hypothetical protein [Ilumatobacter nonamiensis]
MNLLAIGWEPELRGLLTVIIAVVILVGSIYLILMTNMGSRLGFLVTIAALAGWMMLMGLTWWIYGIGLRGADPSWQPVAGASVLQDTEALRSAGVLEELPDVPVGATPAQEAEVVSNELVSEGFIVLDPASPAFGQASAEASVLLEEAGAFAAGEYTIVDIFDIGGARSPMIEAGAIPGLDNDSLDFLAFRHEPHYVLVEAAPNVQVRTEDGRAPVSPTIDETQQRQYVYMVRDLGTRRQPAVVLTIGGGAIFFALCYLLHRRDRHLAENLANAKAVATA